MEITPLQHKFVNNLLKGMDQKNAYIKAGYKARGNSAESKASRLVRNGKVKAVYDKLQARAEKKAKVNRIRILEEYAKVAFLDPRQFFDEHGNIIPIHKLDKNVSAALARHLGMFNDKVNVGLEAEVIKAILAGLPEELRRSVIESLNRHISSGRN